MVIQTNFAQFETVTETEDVAYVVGYVSRNGVNVNIRTPIQTPAAASASAAEAVGAAQDAQGHADAASTSAGTANTRAIAAGSSATTAGTAATSAGTSAGAATTAATASSTSATAAEVSNQSAITQAANTAALFPGMQGNFVDLSAAMANGNTGLLNGLLASTKSAELAAANGSKLVRWIQSGANAFGVWVEDKLRQKVNLLDFIPEAERSAILSGSSNFDCAPSLAAAIASIYGGKIDLPKGRFCFNSPTAINKDGLRFNGEGYRTNIVVKHTGDLFVISATLPQFSNMEISIESGDRANGYIGAAAIGPDTYPTYSGGSIFNCVDGGSLGKIKDIRLTGKASINNGVIVRNDGSAAPGWSYRNIVVSGGALWASCWRLTTPGTTSTNATHKFNNVGGTSVIVQDAAIFVDGLIDTLTGVDVAFDCWGGPQLWTRCSAPIARTFFPRWVRLSQSMAEAGTNAGYTGTCFKIDSVLDMQVTGGYAQSCTHALEIGPDVRGIRFTGTIFGLTDAEAVIIQAGSQGVDLDGCTYLNTASKNPNTNASVLVKAGASGWKVRNSRFSHNGDIAATSIPLYHISIEAGASDNYDISGNIANFAAGTAALSNLATGSNFTILQNFGFGVPNIISGFASVFNNSIGANGGITLRGPLIADTGPILIDSSVKAISMGVGTLIAWGTVNPEASVTAPPGSTYHRQSGGAGTSFYVKESGSGNTGWIAK